MSEPQPPPDPFQPQAAAPAQRAASTTGSRRVSRGMRDDSGRQVGDQDGNDEGEGDDGSFVPARARNDRPSILPSSAFFTPRKPNNRLSATPSPRAATVGLPASRSRPSSPAAARTAATTSPPPRTREDDVPPASTAVPSAMADDATAPSIGNTLGSNSSDGHTTVVGAQRNVAQRNGSGAGSSSAGGATAAESHPPPQTPVEAPRSVVSGQASRDPLLPSGQDKASTASSAVGGYAAQAFQPRNARLGGRPTVDGRGGSIVRGRDPFKDGVDGPSRGGHRRQRNYRSLRGSNRFFLGGLVMTSDDNPLAFLASLTLMVGVMALWLASSAAYIWHHLSPAPVVVFAYVWLVGFVSMCVTAWRDPGVLPRDLDPDPPCAAGESGGYLDPEDPLAVPLPRVVRVRNQTDIKIKWCETCGTYRPPRSSHCRVCDNCVENIDHHCTFLNTCIGRRNYFSFFAFLVFTILSVCLCAALSAVHLYLLTKSAADGGEDLSFRQALSHAPLAAVTFVVPIVILGPLATLFGYHVRLVLLNRTTVEQIRINSNRQYSAEKSTVPDDEDDVAGYGDDGRMLVGLVPCGAGGSRRRRRRRADPNPFAHASAMRNVADALARPMSQSWIERYKRRREDTRRPNPATLAAAGGGAATDTQSSRRWQRESRGVEGGAHETVGSVGKAGRGAWGGVSQA